LGDDPRFKKPLHVGSPNVGNREEFLSRVEDILDRNWLTNNGPVVQEFENKIAEHLGVKHCIAMCNGTVALEIAIRALDLKGEVIVPSFTFVATAHSLQWQEIKPVFCDIDRETYCLDPSELEKHITSRTTAILGVHLFGRPCDINTLNDLSRKHQLKLLFDASHAFGCTYQGQLVGNFGECEVFSFHATKLLNTLEGGAIVTNNDSLAKKVRLMKNFGFDGLDHVVYIGSNGKMNEVNAAMGLTNMDRLDSFVETNVRNYKKYSEALKEIPGIELITYDQKELNNYHYIVIEVDEGMTGVSRDLLVDILRAENVLARRYFYPGCHRMEPYKTFYPTAGGLLPHTHQICRKIMVLPTGSQVAKDDIDKICSIIRGVVADSKEILRLQRERSKQ